MPLSHKAKNGFLYSLSCDFNFIIFFYLCITYNFHSFMLKVLMLQTLRKLNSVFKFQRLNLKVFCCMLFVLPQRTTEISLSVAFQQITKVKGLLNGNCKAVGVLQGTFVITK